MTPAAPQLLDEARFDELADNTLRALVDALGQYEDSVDAELTGGVLSLEFEDGAQYVINSHRAARQVWVAAERRAWHFDWSQESNTWLDSKSGDALTPTLEQLLSQKLSATVRLA